MSVWLALSLLCNLALLVASPIVIRKQRRLRAEIRPLRERNRRLLVNLEAEQVYTREVTRLMGDPLMRDPRRLNVRITWKRRRRAAN